MRVFEIDLSELHLNADILRIQEEYSSAQQIANTYDKLSKLASPGAVVLPPHYKRDIVPI